MLSSVLSALVANIPKEVVSGLLKYLATREMKNALRAAIRDLLEDEITTTVRDMGLKREDAERYIKKNRSKYKKEIRNRFDPIFMMVGRK